MIYIIEPIWKNRSVGIAREKIIDDIEVEILYKDKYGNRTFPGVYRMDREKALSYPTQIVKGKTLKIIPIKDFKTEKTPDKETEEPKKNIKFGDTNLIHEMKWKKK